MTDTAWIKEFGVNMSEFNRNPDQWAKDMLANKQAKSVGMYGETWACSQLERGGYMVERQKEGGKCGDLRAVDKETGEIFRVEVKTSRRGKDGVYRFCLERQVGARVCTSIHHSDFVILLAVTKMGTIYPFVLPVVDGMPKHISITTHPTTYTGKYARFRQKPGCLRLEVLSCAS